MNNKSNSISGSIGDHKAGNEVCRKLQAELNECCNMIEKAEKRIARNAEYRGIKVFCHKRKNSYQYYLQNPDNKRKYIRKSEYETVQKVLQLGYDEEVLKALHDKKLVLERFLAKYKPFSLETLYTGLSDGRKAMIKTIYPTDTEFINDWYKDFVEDDNPYPKETSYRTDRGESVRSKSEKIIADILYKYGIPYVYEPKLRLNNGKNLFPDFALLDLKARKTIYWEHFGLASDGEYASKAMTKLGVYENEGFVVGRDLLFSVESSETPLNIKVIERKVRAIL
ncbi:MAG: hypothetical protein IJ195_08820 [Lachnospiraceae bacterium]|nr:hypothetical protein [Lachnospiraceae bacterium]